MTGHDKCKCGKWISKNKVMCHPCFKLQWSEEE